MGLTRGERVAGAFGSFLGSVAGGAAAGFRKQNPLAGALYEPSHGQHGAPAAENLTANTKAYGVSSVVYSCVYAIASQGASVPLMLYRRKGTDRREWEKLPGHPILEHLRNPNPDAAETDFDLLEALFSDWELSGSWYLYTIRRSDGLPERSYRLRPDLTRPVPSKKRRVDGYVMKVRGETLSFDRDEVTQSRTFHPTSDLDGLSSLAAARLSVTLDVQSLLWNIGFFKNDASPSGVLKVEGKLDPDIAKGLREEWDKGHSARRGKSHRTAILQGGLDWKPIGIPHKDMEFVLQRKMSREDIMMCFHVPPAIIGIHEYSNYANAGEQRKSFWHETEIPKLVKMQRALTRGLCRPYDKNLVLEFDLTKVFALTQDALETAKVDAELIHVGMYTINERRAERGLGPLKWGDVFWQQMQYYPVDDDTNPITEPSSGTQSDDGEESKALLPAPVKGRRLYTDARRLRGRDLAWEAVIAPSRAQFGRKVVTLLGKQEKDVIARIKGEKRTLGDIRVLIERRAKNQAEGVPVTAEMLKDAASVEIESWLFDYEYWQAGSIKAVHPTLLHATNQAGIFAIGELGIEIGFDLANPRVQEAIRDKEFVFAREWNASTLDSLRDTLGDGVLAGESQRELIDRVNVAFEHEKNNAGVVAQTEVGAVSNAGSVEGYRQSDVVADKEWHAGGPNPRPHHAEANGQVVGLDDDFTVMGEQLRYPGDPRGASRNVCGCHCSVLPVLKEE